MMTPSAQTLPPTVGRAAAYTVCFSGTGCTRDEGEATRPESDKRIYCTETGYIPVRIHQEISGLLKADDPSLFPSAIVRGPGENDWAQPRNSSEPLKLGLLKASDALLREAQKYSGGDQHGGFLLKRWEAL